MNSRNREWRLTSLCLFALTAASALSCMPVSAQAPSENASGDEYIDELRKCQAIAEDSSRLACFDAAALGLVTANETGEVRLIDKEDVRQARRQLFGLAAPEVDLLKPDEGEEVDNKYLESQIVSVRYLSRQKIQFTTTEGALWEIKRAPKRLKRVEAGDKVVFKKASLGSFFIRIEGQLGVKGGRVR